MSKREPLHLAFALRAARATLLLSAVLAWQTVPASAATRTWSGAGANNIWSTTGH